MSDIPEWAKERAVALAKEDGAGESLTWQHVASVHTATAFARYISEHEEPPVDPLLIEARRIAYDIRRGVATDSASMNGRTADLILRGGWDDHQLVNAAFAALKRGIELGRQS